MFSLSCIREYSVLTTSVCLKNSALETGPKVVLSEEHIRN